MNITDELREYADEALKRPDYMAGLTFDLDRIADRIDAEYQKAEDEWKAKDGQTWLRGYAECHDELMEGNETLASDLEKAGWAKRYVDADGEYIHIGDMMCGTCPSGKYVCGEVSAIGDNKLWLRNVQFSLRPDYMHHYHAPTVEDILKEFADVVRKERIELATITEETIAEYAKRLQLAGEDE